MYEAYIHLFRSYSPDAKGMANQHPTVVLRKLQPFTSAMLDCGRALDSVHSTLAHNSGFAMHQEGDAAKLVADCLSQAERLVVNWQAVAKANPGLSVKAARKRFEGDIELNGPTMTALEARLIKHLSFDERREANVVPAHVDRPAVAKSWAHLLPPNVRRHKAFYFLLVLVYLSVMMPFLVSVGQGKMRGFTFLPLPPQYCFDCLEGGEGVEIQIYLIPFVFAVMHTALLSLGLLPIPLCRGLLRDFWNSDANRAFFPVEDNVWLHKLFGTLFLLALIVGPLLWLIAMGSSCLGTATSDPLAQKLACTAFAPLIIDAVEGPLPVNKDVNPNVLNPDLRFDSIPGGSFFDPRDNVLWLRIMVWPLFYGVMPWILDRGRKRWPWFVPGFISRWWFEWTTYTHYAIGWIAVFTALYARFEVFFPVILGWQLLLYNNYRELVLNTFAVDINCAAKATEDEYALIHRSDLDEKPTAVELVIPCPDRFDFAAGQYLMIKIPDIDPYYHTFSLASCPADEAIHLLIGIQGKTIKAEDGTWMQKDPTWTYRLHNLIRDRDSVAAADCTPIAASVRGPYGSMFQCCYSDEYKATVLVGSGTGLTSALSVLKEVIERRNPKYGRPKDMSDRVWFVWSCRNVQDLKWCWRTLQKALVNACASGAIELDEDWCSETSTMLGWLGVSIYVSQANKDKLLEFLGYDEPFDPTIADAAIKNRTTSGASSVGAGSDHSEDSIKSLKARTVKVASADSNASRLASVANKMRSGKSSGAVNGIAAKWKRGIAQQITLNRATYAKGNLYAIVNSTIAKSGAKPPEERSIYVSSQQRSVLLPFDLETSQGGLPAPAADVMAAQPESAVSDLVKEYLGSTQDRKAEEELLRKIMEHKQTRQKIDVGAWLKEQVIASSMDSNGVHIRTLMEDVVDLPDDRRRRISRRVAVCYCGPHGLAHSLSGICSDLGIHFEFLAHAE